MWKRSRSWRSFLSLHRVTHKNTKIEKERMNRKYSLDWFLRIWPWKHKQIISFSSWMWINTYTRFKLFRAKLIKSDQHFDTGNMEQRLTERWRKVSQLFLCELVWINFVNSTLCSSSRFWWCLFNNIYHLKCKNSIKPSCFKPCDELFPAVQDFFHLRLSKSAPLSHTRASI